LFTADVFGALARRIRVGVSKACCTDPPTGETLGRELLEEEFDTTIMSHGKLLHASAHRQLKEAFARSRY
jgi:hypothetical protein